MQTTPRWTRNIHPRETSGHAPLVTIRERPGGRIGGRGEYSVLEFWICGARKQTTADEMIEMRSTGHRQIFA